MFAWRKKAENLDEELLESENKKESFSNENTTELEEEKPKKWFSLFRRKSNELSEEEYQLNQKSENTSITSMEKEKTYSEIFSPEIKEEEEDNIDLSVINDEYQKTLESSEVKIPWKAKKVYSSIEVDPLKNNKVLEVKNLHVSFPVGRKKTIHIVRGIDLDVYKGQIIGLVGESGSGKSVTSKTLININHNGIVSADKIQINNLELTKLKQQSSWQFIRGKKIGYIPQDPLTSLNPTRTIGKQLLDAINTNPAWANETYTNKRAYLIGLLEQFGLRNADTIFKAYPHTLSGGMKQRVVITMVVALKPDVIIADEPTTALDPTVQASVLSLFENIRRKYNISIILISHNISVIAKFCDYIYVMYAGKIIERGTKKEIFTTPAHPYTWALISAIPETKDEKLYNIKGTPPDMANLPLGDPFASRNDYALDIDFIKEPPLIPITRTHSAATWLLHPNAPKVELSEDLLKRLDLFKETFKEYHE
ncbi:Oligopeptide transport system permease protein OppB [Mycoplasmopsis meleagridis]|nr:Oligopeptide transport system permease protein OppB [Mycoplasmopsis meleagridis]